MEKKKLIVGILVFGSLWGFAECVIGPMLRDCKPACRGDHDRGVRFRLDGSQPHVLQGTGHGVGYGPGGRGNAAF